MRRRRCLVPADGFYDWKVESGRNRPYCARPRDGGPIQMIVGSHSATNSSRAVVSADLVVVGVGMGTMFQTFVIATQNRVDFAELGVATAAIQFFRSMGGSIAVAGLGALLVARGTGSPAELAGATHAVFVAIVPVAALILALAFALPEHTLRTTTAH